MENEELWHYVPSLNEDPWVVGDGLNRRSGGFLDEIPAALQNYHGKVEFRKYDNSGDDEYYEAKNHALMLVGKMVRPGDRIRFRLMDLYEEVMGEKLRKKTNGMKDAIHHLELLVCHKHDD